MIVTLSEIVIDPKMRGMCRVPYPGHPKGCPNFDHKAGCPPQCPTFSLVAPWYAIVNEFDLAAHVARLKAKYPTWTDRQLRCCLYWQPAARKQLMEEITRFYRGAQDAHWHVDPCPEAGGVNVTETLRRAGLALEWPPVNIVRQVAIAGIRPAAGDGQ